MICSFNTGATVANVIAVSFFITMLGFSLAFPSLLEGSEGLSTMRIVVFMKADWQFRKSLERKAWPMLSIPVPKLLN
jgi:hypothetical protein